MSDAFSTGMKGPQAIQMLNALWNGTRNNGLKYVWSTDTGVSNPTAGKVKVNHGTLASANTLSISETDGDTNAIAALLLQLGASTGDTKSTLLIRKANTPTSYAAFNVTSSVTDAGAYDTMTVGHVASAGTLGDGDTVYIEWVRHGNVGPASTVPGPAGDAGDDGTDGRTLLSGAGAPDDGSDGADGDFYIDTTDWDIYGPKTAGAWGSGTSLKGADGAGTGDVSGPVASVDSEVALYSGTGGKTLKRASITGLALLTAGVLSAIALDTDTTLAADSDTRVASQKAVKAYVATQVAGLFDLKGSTNCSGNPNYPAALKGDTYVVSTAGKIGGASGKTVDIGDIYVAAADNAGGTEASVGTSWFAIEHNLAGALLAANNLSDLANAATARSNLGFGNVDNTSDATKNSAAVTLTNKTFLNVLDTVYPITDGAAFAIDPTNGGIQTITLGASRTPVAANFSAGHTVTLMVADGSAFAVTWTTVAVTWVGGSAPTLPTSGYAVITLWKVGSTIYGAHMGNVA